MAVDNVIQVSTLPPSEEDRPPRRPLPQPNGREDGKIPTMSHLQVIITNSPLAHSSLVVVYDTLPVLVIRFNIFGIRSMSVTAPFVDLIQKKKLLFHRQLTLSSCVCLFMLAPLLSLPCLSCLLVLSCVRVPDPCFDSIEQFRLRQTITWRQ